MDINLELYKVFYYVATSLSFSEASRQLFISQSAVSQSIKTLEKKLNHTLFIRSTKKSPSHRKENFFCSMSNRLYRCSSRENLAFRRQYAEGTTPYRCQ